MAFDEGLAARIQDALPRGAWSEKRMFGGIAWFDRGNLAIGVLGDDVIARLGPAAEQALAGGALPFAPTGRPMAGWCRLPAEMVADDDQLRDWVAKAQAFTVTLPAK